MSAISSSVRSQASMGTRSSLFRCVAGRFALLFATVLLLLTSNPSVAMIPLNAADMDAIKAGHWQDCGAALARCDEWRSCCLCDFTNTCPGRGYAWSCSAVANYQVCSFAGIFKRCWGCNAMGGGFAACGNLLTDSCRSGVSCAVFSKQCPPLGLVITTGMPCQVRNCSFFFK